MNLKQIFSDVIRLELRVILVFSLSAFLLSCRYTEEKLYYPDDFTSYEDLEIYHPGHGNRFLRLLPGVDKGQVIRQYFGQSAKYTASLSGTNGQACVIDRLTLIQEGNYQGDQISLPRPQTLRVYKTTEEQQSGHAMLQQFVQERVDIQLAKRDSLLSTFTSPEQWRAYQKQVRDNLSSILGVFPEKTPLNPRVVGRIDYPDYYIEQIIYESQPDFFVPANVYIPKDRDFPLPGVLVTIGHANDGKMFPLYHKTCIGLAKKGYIAIAADPIGQGERSEYFEPETLEPTVRLGVAQHHYVSRPASLVDWTLPGIRTWDCIRALDYLVSRPEVDTSKLAVAGNSGGGQMAILTAAVDKRIKVVAAAHPGGSCEETFLTGRFIPERDLYSLVPPVPCRMIVGEASGEAEYRGRKLADMARFYRGLGVSEDYWGMDLVDGLHDMMQPKRESTYGWLNQWFDKIGEGKEEPFVEDEDIKTLWCTENGLVLASLGGESGQTLNHKRGEQIYQQVRDSHALKKPILNRLHLKVPEQSSTPPVKLKESFTWDDISVETFVYVSEPGIEIPALLLRPLNRSEKQQVILHVSGEGKPNSLDISSLPLSLVKAGYPVLTIDVRGTGETATQPLVGKPDKYTGFRRSDIVVIEAASIGRTMLGMQTLDVWKGIDLIAGRSDFKDKSIIVIGEGVGGLWALLSGIYHPQTRVVITVNTLPSYMLLLSGKYYNQFEYFYVPGALRDYDIPDLRRLVSTGNQLWIDPVNELSERMISAEAKGTLRNASGLQIVLTSDGLVGEISEEILEFIKNSQ